MSTRATADPILQRMWDEVDAHCIQRMHELVEKPLPVCPCCGHGITDLGIALITQPVLLLNPFGKLCGQCTEHLCQLYPPMRSILLFTTALLISCETPTRGLEGPLWEREGGLLNPFSYLP